MQELVFSPLQMSHSTFAQPLAATLAAEAASGHDDKGQAIQGRWSAYPELAAAGLWTTPTDLSRIALALQQAFKGESEQILSQELARAMLTRQASNYGLGVELIGVAKTLRFSHQGANHGFRCVMVAWPATGQGAVVMTNGERGDKLANELLRSLAKEYQWPGFTTVGRTLAAIDPAIYRDYIGRYQAGKSIINISTESGRLYLQASATETPRMELYPLAENRFFLSENEAEISFVRVAQERVTALQLVRGGVPLTAPRLP
jgi:CubicO group peptidase (beta-lactamase class C family)